MSRDQLLAAGGGALSALLSLSAFTGSPWALVLIILSQLPLFLVGFGLGVVPAAVACGVASVILAGAVTVSAGGYFLLTTALPVMIIVNLVMQSRAAPDGSLEWYPPGYALCWLSALGAVFITSVALYFSASEGGLKGEVHLWIKGLIENMPMRGSPEQSDAMAGAFARFAPAMAVTWGLVVIVINAILAQNMLARFGRNLRPSAKFIDLELPRWPSYAVAVAAAASLIPGQVGFAAQNCLMILAIPFLFLGLAVIHSISHRLHGRGFILFLLYLLLFFLQWPAILVAGLGIVEQWTQLRRRFATPHRGQEEE